MDRTLGLGIFDIGPDWLRRALQPSREVAGVNVGMPDEHKNPGHTEISIYKTDTEEAARKWIDERLKLLGDNPTRAAIRAALENCWAEAEEHKAAMSDMQSSHWDE